MIVTSIDEKGNESLPSNEIELKTPNMKPNRPSNIQFEKHDQVDAVISWEKANDPDGEVVGYQIYAHDGENQKLLGTSEQEQFILKNWVLYTNNDIQVTAIDNHRGESLPESRRLYDGKTMLRIKPGLLMPIGTLSEMGDLPGYGATLMVARKIFFEEKMELFLEAGFFDLPGKTFFNDAQQKFAKIYIFPLYMGASWTLWKNQYLRLAPTLALGGCLTYLDYSYWNLNSTSYDPETFTIFDIGLKLGISLEHEMRSSLLLQFYSDFNLLIEKPGLVLFLNAGLGLGYRF
jgi:hypothetical protein